MYIYVGLKGEVVNKCISRIAELSSFEDAANSCESEYEKMIFEAIYRSRHIILIGSSPDYIKTSWIKDEWTAFNNKIREGRKNGNLLLLLTDDIAGDKGRLPGQLRQKEIVKMSEFRNCILVYLR